jgi:hypothetical protein
MNIHKHKFIIQQAYKFTYQIMNKTRKSKSMLEVNCIRIILEKSLQMGYRQTHMNVIEHLGTE